MCVWVCDSWVENHRTVKKQGLVSDMRAKKTMASSQA